MGLHGEAFSWLIVETLFVLGGYIAIFVLIPLTVLWLMRQD